MHRPSIGVLLVVLLSLFTPGAVQAGGAAVVIIMQQAATRQRQQNEERRRQAAARTEHERRQREAEFFRRQSEEKRRITNSPPAQPSVAAQLAPGTHQLERNIVPAIKDYLLEKEKTNLAGAAVLYTRVAQWNELLVYSSETTPIFIPKTALSRWKNDRYGITGLTRREIETCRTAPNSHGPIDALQADARAQLACYGIVVSRCFGMRVLEWNTLSKWFAQTGNKQLLEWAKKFVTAGSACTKCPCTPPMPNGLIWTPAAGEPEVEAEILCLGNACRR